MTIFLEVQSGPRKGQRVRLNPGQTLRVGRTAKSDLAIAEDSLMSGIHFELECGENACQLRDLNSRNGTSLNGQKLKQSALRHGDRIVAGGTTFLLQMEGNQSPVAEAQPALPVDATPHDRLLSMLRRDFQPLYAILDAARDVKILALLLQYKEEFQSLYEGPDGAELAQVAPYLVKLKKDSTLLDTLVREGWGQSWGVYLTSPSEFADVRRHLRHFLEVKLPDGKQVYFRFYDPRVLRTYLPTCTAEETNHFFGPIKKYLIEGEKLEKLLQFVNQGRGPVKSAIPLSPEIPAEPTLPQPGTEFWAERPVPDPR
jgi:pSer/pThr/pTyr-binding forkhead associated (FHA) protein